MSIKITTKVPTNPVAVTLPTWTDSASVTSYLTSALSAVVGWVALVHPGFHAPAVVATYVPIVGFVIAGAAQFINIWTHRAVRKAAVAAQSGVIAALSSAGVSLAELEARGLVPARLFVTSVDNSVGQTGGPIPVPSA